MKKILIALFLLPAFIAAAQTGIELPTTLMGSEEKLILRAVDSTIWLIRQEYVLEDRQGNAYGYKNKTYFGRSFRLGLFAENKIWSDSSIVEPWEYDPVYRTGKPNLDTLTPTLSATMVRQSAGSWTMQETAYKNAGGNFNTVFMEPKAAKSPALPILRGDKNPDGWLVVMYTPIDPNTADSFPIQYMVYKPKPQIGGDMRFSSVLKTPPVKGFILGGIYCVATVSTGEIRISATGLLDQNHGNYRIAFFPPKAENLIPNLTPINKDKEKEKEETKEEMPSATGENPTEDKPDHPGTQPGKVKPPKKNKQN